MITPTVGLPYGLVAPPKRPQRHQIRPEPDFRKAVYGTAFARL